ncbi:BRO-N domain-containing protein [Chamaesiphon polymorphus]|uniref:Bro-N domain-containing protein n=1 Tax=Chamaesiphon polymorphus CCALA 037 TaxID=2107692 RepID=A0A2T1FVH1_9CYAN|nr:BRO family protein [Chamaesiphon polymorphus]PSB48995.1 hypothetical protein C7B77_23600 [Chamaesiphon polymorphus CCALA 037]
MSVIHLFEGQEVRFVGIWENPEWIAADVCVILGIKEAPSSMRDFDEDEAGMCTMQVRSENGVEQARQVLTVKEQGLYRLISMSRKPLAKQFRKWMFGEVLLSIRKTGSYSIAQPPQPTLEPIDLLRGCLKSGEVGKKAHKSISYE